MLEPRFEDAIVVSIVEKKVGNLFFFGCDVRFWR